jgi:RND family efflux transporter MFP subunit
VYRTGPTTEPETPQRSPKIVKTVTPLPATHAIRLSAYGSVVPARRVVIEPQVSGHVIRQHPGLRPGGQLKTDEELYAIDPRLTELDLAEAEADLKRVRAVLLEARRKLEEGRRLATELVIPATELAALESAVEIQKAELERLTARRDRNVELLERHIVRAPFNALVIEEAVELGQRVTPGDATVTLVGTDEFWVQAALPTDQVPWVRLPEANRPGASVQVDLDTGEGRRVTYRGEVVQLLGDLDQVGRMARVLIRVTDPLQLAESADRPPLLLGSYVRVGIDAGELHQVLAVDRAAVREGNRIWVVDANSRLQIREVTVRWREGETLLIDVVLKPNESLIVSDLRVALPDQEVKPQPAEDELADASPAPVETL